KSIDSTNRKTLVQIELLQHHATNAALLSNRLIDATNFRITNFVRQLWRPEEKIIWNARPTDYNTNFVEALKRSLGLTKLNVTKYIIANPSHFIIQIMLVGLLFFWVTFNIRR